MSAVQFANLKCTFELHQQEYEEAALRVLRSGWYVLGDELKNFEAEFASYVGVKECVGVGCGQDALILAIRALDIGRGDEVIVAGNTYIATVLGITENGATPVLVDCNDYYEIDENLIERAITKNTKAVLITNLYGQCANLPTIKNICEHNNLLLVEDCAQSHGAVFGSQKGGSVGDISCFSFYPTKPLGAFGDAGAIVTDDPVLADKVRMLRNYGSKKKYYNESTGINSRLDELQAALLRVGLSHLEESNSMRIAIAQRYLLGINNPSIELPKTRPGANHVYHIFAIRSKCRDALQKHLESCGVQTQIHYPIPPHKAPCYEGETFTKVSLPLTEKFAAEQLSLPIYSGMSEEEIETVISAVNSFEG